MWSTLNLKKKKNVLWPLYAHFSLSKISKKVFSGSFSLICHVFASGHVSCVILVTNAGFSPSRCRTNSSMHTLIPSSKCLYMVDYSILPVCCEKTSPYPYNTHGTQLTSSLQKHWSHVNGFTSNVLSAPFPFPKRVARRVLKSFCVDTIIVCAYPSIQSVVPPLRWYTPLTAQFTCILSLIMLPVSQIH